MLVHATTVALGQVAALLRGASGAGKSDLALRFLADQGRWPDAKAVRGLIADDQTQLSVDNGRLVGCAPPAIAGLLEVRGVGIVAVPIAPPAEVRVVIDLVAPDGVERFPDGARTCCLLGVDLDWYALDPRTPSAPIKLALILSRVILPKRSPTGDPS